MQKHKPIPDGIKILMAGAAAALIAFAPAEAAPGGYRADKAAAHEAAELLRGMGYADDNPVIQAASAWWHETHAEQMAAYPVASEVWEALTGAGFSEPVAAGILGNMMAECGGHTLQLLPETTAAGYYGLCMWSLDYFPQVAGADVAGQLAVLLDTLESNLEAGGGSYERFCAMDDCREAARYFDRYYERSVGLATEQRAQNAAVALAYYGTEAG